MLPGEDPVEQKQKQQEEQDARARNNTDGDDSAQNPRGTVLPAEKEGGSNQLLAGEAEPSTGLGNSSSLGAQGEQVLMPRERLDLLLKKATEVSDQEQIKKCNAISQKYQEVEALREMEENKNRPKIQPLQFAWLELLCGPAKEPSLSTGKALPKMTITPFGCIRRSTRASADSMVKKLEVEKENPLKAEKYKKLAEVYDNSGTLLMRSWQEEETHKKQNLTSRIFYSESNRWDVDALYLAGILQWRSARIQQFILEELEDKQVDDGGAYANDQNEIKQCYEQSFQLAEEARDYFLKAHEEPKNSDGKIGLRNVAFLLRDFSSIKLAEAETKKGETNRQSGQDDFYSSLESTLQDAVKAGKAALQQKVSVDRNSIYGRRLIVQSYLSGALHDQLKLKYNIEMLEKADANLSGSKQELISYQGILERNTLAISFLKQAGDDLELRGGVNFDTLFTQGADIQDEVRKIMREKKITLGIKGPFPIEE